MIYLLVIVMAFFYYLRGKIYGTYFKKAIDRDLHKKIDGFIFMAVNEIGLFISVFNILLRYIYYPTTNIIMVPAVIALSFFVRWAMYSIVLSSD